MLRKGRGLVKEEFQGPMRSGEGRVNSQPEERERTET
jgi:hypothetical protein